jgi:hypothetical protein
VQYAQDKLVKQEKLVFAKPYKGFHVFVGFATKMQAQKSPREAGRKVKTPSLQID